MPDVLIDNKAIYNFEYKFITFCSYVTKLTVFLFMIGFFQQKPTSYVKLNIFIKTLISVFLIYRFNKYRTSKIVFTELDRKVVYFAGVYILTLTFIDLYEHYMELLRSHITKYTLPIVTKIKEFIPKDLVVKLSEETGDYLYK